MSTVADIRRRIEKLAGALTPPRELQLLSRLALLDDEQRCEWQRHQAAVEQFYATARDAGLEGGALYAAMLQDGSRWRSIFPKLRQDVRDVLFDPVPEILVTDTAEQAARKYYEFAGIGITASSHRRGRR